MNLEKIKAETIKVVYTHEIALKDLEDLLCCAFEGGIGYWCQIYGYKAGDPKNLYVEKGMFTSNPHKYITYPLSPGYQVLLRDYEDKQTKWTLSLAKVKKGLQVMAVKYPKHFSDFLRENYDANTGDIFVQCCLFGEIVYG